MCLLFARLLLDEVGEELGVVVGFECFEFGERGEGEVALAEGGVGESGEVVGPRCVWPKLYSLAGGGERFVVLVEAVVGLAEALEGVGVGRLLLEDSAEILDGLFVAAVGVADEAELEERERVVGVYLKQPLEGLFGLLQTTGLDVRLARGVVCAHGVHERVVGLALASELDVGEGEVEVCLTVVRFDLYGVAEGGDRFLEATHGEVCASQVIVRGGERRVGAYCLAVLLDGLFELAL